MVSINANEIKKTADEIRRDNEEFKRIIKEIYEILDENLGAEYGPNKAWWGTKSEIFLKNAQKKQDEFDIASNNLNALATALDEQVDIWANFENNQ